MKKQTAQNLNFLDKINKLKEINNISEHLTSFPLAPLAEDKKFLVEEGQTPDTFTVAMFADSTNTQFYKKNNNFEKRYGSYLQLCQLVYFDWDIQPP